MGKEIQLHADDVALVERVKAGDQKAFEQIVRQYKSMMARVIVGMLGNQNDADDVGQEAFIRFYRSVDQYKGDASLGTYLTRIAINLSLNALKKRKSRQWVSLEEKHDSMQRGQSPEHRSDDEELVRKALEQLAPKYRAVVVLRLMQGYSTKETAKILKLPLGTVLSRLARAQEKLKPIIEKLEG